MGAHGPETTLTQGIIEFTVEALEKGNFIKPTMEAQGYSRSTYYHWLSLGVADIAAGNPDTIHARLSIEVGKAQSRAELDIITRIVDIGRMSADDKTRFTTLSFILERKFGKWNKANKSVSVDATKEELAEMDDDELRHLMSQTFPGQTPDEGEGNE